MTIADAIERALKKGGDNEKAAAANLSSLLCIQLGAIDIAENSYQELLATLMFVVNDESVPLLAREKVTYYIHITLNVLFLFNINFYIFSVAWP